VVQKGTNKAKKEGKKETLGRVPGVSRINTLRQPRIERGAHRESHANMATMDFTTKPLTLFEFDEDVSGYFSLSEVYGVGGSLTCCCCCCCGARLLVFLLPLKEKGLGGKLPTGVEPTYECHETLKG
jgi:hypothetical protein